MYLTTTLTKLDHLTQNPKVPVPSHVFHSFSLPYLQIEPAADILDVPLRDVEKDPSRRCNR